MKKVLFAAASVLLFSGAAIADEASMSETHSTTTTAAPVVNNVSQTRSHTSVHSGPLGTSVHHSKTTVNSTGVAPVAETTTSHSSSTSVTP